MTWYAKSAFNYRLWMALRLIGKTDEAKSYFWGRISEEDAWKVLRSC